MHLDNVKSQIATSYFGKNEKLINKPLQLFMVTPVSFLFYRINSINMFQFQNSHIHTLNQQSFYSQSHKRVWIHIDKVSEK